MAVLRNIARLLSCRLFLPAKTGRIPKFEFCDIEAACLSVELAKLLSSGVVHNGHDSVEGDSMALIADAAHRHQWSRYRRYLENRLQVTVLVREVQRALT